MPSGTSHDAITVLLGAPVAVLAYAVTQDLPTAVIATVAFIFAGVMFGPDLDTKSKQYSRWGPLRMLWIPYRTVFRHRSRWSHGLIFGTLFRVVYFLGAVSIIAFLAFAAYSYATDGSFPNFITFARGWESIGAAAGADSTIELLLTVLTGMWLGAASHTLTDISVTYIKTGRVDGLF